MVHEAPFLGPSEMWWFGSRGRAMEPLLLPASALRPAYSLTSIFPFPGPPPAVTLALKAFSPDRVRSRRT